MRCLQGSGKFTINTHVAFLNTEKKNMPQQLSLLIPFYNAQTSLRACLESVLEQDVDLEVLCIDDGSTDASADIVRSFAKSDERFRLISKDNSGYGATLNVGLEAAAGNYLAILESDDKLYPHALDELVATAEQFSADVVKGSYSLWWSQSDRDSEQHEVPPEFLGKPLCPREYSFTYLLRATDWSYVYRRTFLEAHKLRFLETAGAAYQDSSFMFKVLCLAQQAVFIDTPTVHYRQDNEASSIHSQNKAFAICTEYDEIESWLKAMQDDPFAPAMNQGFLVSKYNAYLWNLDRLSDDLASRFAERIAQEFSRHEEEGLLDWATFDSWKADNLKALLKNPQAYVRMRRRWRGSSALAKSLFALRLGGPRELVQALHARTSR